MFSKLCLAKKYHSKSKSRYLEDYPAIYNLNQFSAQNWTEGYQAFLLKCHSYHVLTI